MRSAALWGLCLMGVVCASSCATYKSRPSPVHEADSGHSVTGRDYFLPKARIEITGTPGQSGAVYTLAVARKLEADKEKRYKLRQTTSGGHDDALVYAVNAKGLVNSAWTATTTSKIKDIVEDVVDTGVNISKIILKQRDFAGGAMANNVDVTPTLQAFKVQFDPYVQSEVKAAARAMQTSGFTLATEELTRAAKYPSSRARRNLRTGEAEASEEGIYYRPQTTVGLSIAMNLSPQNVILNTDVPIPDKDDVAVFRMSRGAFTTRTETVTFADGEITGVNSTRPSEVKAFTAIPVSVTSKVLTALPSIGSLFWRDPNADIKAETERAKADTARLQAEKALLDQKMTNAQLRANLEGAGAGGSPSNAMLYGDRLANTYGTGGETYQPAATQTQEQIQALRKEVEELARSMDDVKALVEKKEGSAEGATFPLENNDQPEGAGGGQPSEGGNN